MDCARNIITANFSGGGTSATTAPLWQWDYGQVLCITGIDLPAAFEVHFSTNRTGGVSTVAVGADGQVTIPNDLLTIGKNLNAWIYLSDAQGEGETEYSITIPVKPRPMPETYDAEVTGEFDDVVRQVSEYAETAQTAADNAGASASAAAASASEAAASASAAETAKNAAETAQGKAEDAQAAAETAAQTATQKAQQTAQDAAQAALDAGRAESAAGRAEAAQTGAESAKTDAETAAQGAADSASAASVSATSAGQAATSAAQSATAAAGSATTAGNAAQTATTKAGEASASATAANTAKTAAQTAQTGAEAAETNAGQSASTASTKAAEAAQSATDSAASKTAAEAAATRAETAAASLTVDSALSDTSVNPVQNKVITGEVTQLKSALKYDVKDISAPYGENIFDDRLLRVGKIKNTGYHEFTGTAQDFHKNFASVMIPVNGAENTYYKLTFDAFASESGAGTGIQFKCVYDDGTEVVWVSCPNTTTTETKFVSGSSNQSKIIKGIKITYGSNGSLTWTIRNIMLSEAGGSSIPVFTPYLTASDKKARNAIEVINEDLIYIDDVNRDIAGVINPVWIPCDVEILTTGWTYYKRTLGINAKRIAPVEGHPIRLSKGDSVGLSDYTNAEYYIGWRVGTTYYRKSQWMSVDTVAPVDGEYCMLIRYKDSRVISSIEELSALFKYKAFTLSEKISALESVAGAGPSNGFAYYGEKINISEYKFSTKELPVAVGQGQDYVVYDHYALGFSADSGTCKVTDLDTNTSVTTFQMPTVGDVIPHFNTAVFGDKMSGQDIPLLYVNVNLPYSESPGLCAVYQITHSGNNWSATLVQTIDISFVGDTEWGTLSTFDAVSFAVFNGKLYAFGASSEKNKTHVCSFAIPSHANDVTLTRTDIIDFFDIVYMSVIQGCMVNGSKLYILDGLGTVNNGKAGLYVVDLIKGGVTSFLNLTLAFSGEPEFIFVHNRQIIFGGVNMIKLEI